MSKDYYMPPDDEGKRLWLENFSLKIGVYHFDLTAADTSLITNGYAWFNFAITMRNATETFNQNVTEWKNLLRNGKGTVMGDAPEFPVIVAPVVANPGPNIFGKLTSLVNRIKNHTNYTVAIGEDLGIEGAEATIDTATWKPVIFTEQQVNVVAIKWKKADADGIDIYADYGTGTFVFVATDNKPNYEDKHTMPAAGQTAVWKYKAIYRYNDEQVGQYSDVVSVTVTGNI